MNTITVKNMPHWMAHALAPISLPPVPQPPYLPLSPQHRTSGPPRPPEGRVLPPAGVQTAVDGRGRRAALRLWGALLLHERIGAVTRRGAAAE